MPKTYVYNLRVDFRRFVMPDSIPFSMEEIFGKALEWLQAGESERANLIRTVGGLRIWLAHLTPVGSFYRGNLILSDTSRTASKALPGQVPVPFDMQDEEGIAEECAFLYQRDLGVLVLQRNHSGLTPSRFKGYWSRLAAWLSGGTGEIEIDHVPKSDALQRLEQMSEVRTLEMRFAGPVNPELFTAGRKRMSGEEIVALKSFLEAPKITIEATMSREPGSMNTEHVTQLVRESLVSSQTDVEKIRVVGSYSEDGAPDVIEFFGNNLTDTIEVNKAPDRTIPYQTRIAALTESYDKHEPSLRSLYGPPTSQ